MTDLLLALVPSYGPWLLAVATFLSCLALPVPASLLMIAGGAFAAGGDLTLAGSALSALAGALLGDQAGFHLGRRAGPHLTRLTRHRPSRAALMARAHAFMEKRGGPGVFLSRWLFSPLGPYVNLIGGATGLNWMAFTIWGVMGEIVWVTLYTGLGFSFADRVEEIASLAGNLSGAAAAGVLALLLGSRLWKSARQNGRH